MQYQAKITIALKEGMLDPEARAIQHALANLGYQTDALTSAKLFFIRFDAKGKKEAEEMAAKMCERLLANPVIHQYTIEVNE
jgi:phosphoribosylformylglycinamidine synthase PurS subunit